tara:strand:- start:697 stop:843 length:147 start_codon:yes stop_codon:yes gene_type:complete
MGKGTYGDKVGRPKKKKSMLKGKQKTLPPALKRKILKAKSGGSSGGSY